MVSWAENVLYAPFPLLSSEISPGLGSYYSPVKVLYWALVKGTTESLP